MNDKPSREDIDPGPAATTLYRGRLVENLALFKVPVGDIPAADLADIEIFPGFPASRLGRIDLTIPAEILPSGQCQRLNDRTIKLSRLPWSSPEQCASFQRSMLSLWRYRHNTRTGTRQWAPTSWLEIVRILSRAALIPLTECRITGEKLWASATFDDYLRVKAAFCNGTPQRHLEMALRTLMDFGKRGILLDYPQIYGDDKNSAPDPFKGQPNIQPTKDDTRQHEPFTLPFIKEFGQRAFWVQDNLASGLLDWVRKDKELVERLLPRYSGGTKNPEIIKRRRALIRSIDWLDAEGRPLTELPFAIIQKLGTTTIRSRQWPPDNPSTLNIMLSALQSANLNTVALCIGARHSELSSATSSHLTCDPMGQARFEAKHFKIAATIGGEYRDWPLPPRAVKALMIQLEFSNVLRTPGSTHLWVKLNADKEGLEGGPLYNLNEPTVKMCKTLGIEPLLLGTRPHSHRWRETVGFLGAICLVSAPQILMDIFGHQNIEMTIHYMLSNPEVHRLIVETAKAMNFALMSDVMEEAEGQDLAGPGGVALNQGLAQWKYDNGIDVLDTEDRLETLEVLTGMQMVFTQPLPNVLCLKQPDQKGLCASGRGEPDVGRCDCRCSYRVERSPGRQDCERLVAQLIGDIEKADKDELSGAVGWLEGQLLAELRRFPDIRVAALSLSTIAQRVWTKPHGQ